MNKIARISIYILLLFAVCISSIIAYLYFNTAVIKNYFVEKMNSQLEAQISIDEINLEFFKEFPKVSLDLKHINISDPHFQKKSLLRAEHVYLGFNLYDVLTKNYEIKLITIDSGICNFVYDRNGQNNFSILKKDSLAKKDDQLFLNLQKLNFTNTVLNYIDFESDQQYHLILNNVNIKGSFTKSTEDFSINGKLFVEKIRTGSVTMIKEKNAEIDLTMEINNDKRIYSIKKCSVVLDELKLDVKGLFEHHEKSYFTNISFKAKQININGLLSVLPIKFEALNEIKSGGNIYFDGTVKGESGNGKSPEINVNFGIQNGKIDIAKNKITIDRINCNGKFTNGNKHELQSSEIAVNNLSLFINNNETGGHFTLHNFTDPTFTAQLKGKLDAKEMVGLFNKYITDATGNILFDLNISGRTADFINKKNLSAVQSSGKIDIALNKIKLTNSDKEIALFNTSLELKQNDIIIKSFQSKIQQSDIVIEGSLNNIIPYYLSDKQIMHAELEYTSNFADFEHFMIPLPKEKQPTETQIKLPENIILNAKVNFKKVNFHAFTATDLSAKINWQQKKISVENLSCKTMNGEINASGQIENALDGRFLITSNANLKDININELFRQCNNFSQTELTDKNLFGVLNAKIEIASVWSSNLTCDLDKLYSFGDLQITNGEIINYKPLEGLSKYASVEDLKHVKFAELKNNIEIKNKSISIPSMDIKSNALNISLSGTHTFNNYVDYKLKIKLSDLLSKKRKAQQNDFNEEDDDVSKGLFLYISMKGPGENPKFSYDKLGVKKKINENVKTEKENIKEILKKELGLKKDSTIKEKQNDNNELEFEKE